jgi:hypothetical protein
MIVGVEPHTTKDLPLPVRARCRSPFLVAAAALSTASTVTL